VACAAPLAVEAASSLLRRGGGCREPGAFEL
jgi:hypothetical protein